MNLKNIMYKEECTDSENECPICHSGDIEAVSSYSSDNYYVYECICSDCDCKFKEYHRLTYECTEYGYEENLFASVKEFFGDDINISLKENNIILINDKEIEIYNEKEYKSLEDISRIIKLPNSKYYCRFNNQEDEDERTSKLLNLRSLLCEHLNMNEDEINLPDQDTYDNEFEVIFGLQSSQIAEVVTKESAVSNEKDFGDDFINTTERVGAYRQLCNSEYYFKWM